MNIENQLRSARNAVRLEAEGQQVFELPITWFEDMISLKVFDYLLKGRIKHDSYQKPDTFGALLCNLEKSNLEFSCMRRKNTLGEIMVYMHNINYRITDWSQVFCVELDLNNVHRGFPHRARLSSESIIRFMREFDRVVPLIHQEAKALHIELAKQKLSNSILSQSLTSIINEALGTIGIPFYYELKNGGIVFRFFLRGHTGLRVRIPADQYATRILELPMLLKNPEVGIRKYGKNFRYERRKK